MGPIYWRRSGQRPPAVTAVPLPVRLVVGLGNPGMQYRYSRHNAGFLVLDRVADAYQTAFRSGRYGDTAEVAVRGRRVYLLKPQTFMNLSGTAVAPFARRHGIVPASILMVNDDLDLPLEAVRVRRKGSSGGHNGLKSCIAMLGTEEFPRVKVGIGRPAPGEPVVDWVLASVAGDERERWEGALDRAAGLVCRILEEGLEAGLGHSGG